ncbi:MAG: CheR family methyltransferase [Candidatus Obscuribacterales bacterium]|nr:CheR family methyltransferase [Candidatus Obscuribacterales bacterium]
MPREIERPQLLRLNDHLAEHIGLTFPSDRLADFQHKITAAAKEFGMEPVDCVNWLLSSALTEAQIHTLSYHLTIGETYFFRDPRTFEILEDEVFSKLIRQRRHGHKYLRIWSAGCCSGEEPYSLAMLLTRMLPDIESWRISILGTDINAAFIKKAQRGVYDPWSFRITSPEMKSRFFTQSQGKYQIAPAIKRMVHFKQMNLVDPRVPEGLILSSFDLIFCRNVLMYFHRDQAVRVLTRLHEALTESGILVSTPFELSAIPDQLFVRLPHKGAVLLGKRSHSCPSGLEGVSPKPTAYVAPVPEPETVAKSKARPKHEHISGHKVDNKVETPIAQADIATQARTLLDAERFDECISLLAPVCSKNKTDASLPYLLAKTYANRGAFAEALFWLDQSLEIDKLNHLAYFTRATVSQAQGNVPEAVRSLKQALFLEPEFILAEFHLASLLLGLGKLQESRKRFQGALSLLSQYNGNELVPEGEGMTAEVLGQIIKSLLKETAK